MPVGPLLDARAVDDDVRGALHADELATLGLGVGADGDDARIDGVLEGAVGSEEALVAASLGHPPGAPPVASRPRRSPRRHLRRASSRNAVIDDASLLPPRV